MSERDDVSPDRDAGEASPEEQLDAYARLRARAAALLAEARHGLNARQLQELGDRAAAELRGLGAHSRDAGLRLGAVLRKDLASTAESLRPRLDALGGDAQSLVSGLRERGGAFWDEVSGEAGKRFVSSRDHAGAVLASVARAVGEWSHQLGDRVDASLVYRTGELTHGGSFTCDACGQGILLKKAGHLPPCPKCHGTAFRRA